MNLGVLRPTYRIHIERQVIRGYVDFRVWIVRSLGKPYRRLPLDRRCTITRAEHSPT
ncbi:hypothetical protein HanRHA438_Chr08g0329881 [Helianthus annuus]|nr:hypothetical protein HanRHA438_Chr08g0329881 [Helianthus annuus]